MAESKVHYAGELQKPGQRPENVELFLNIRDPARPVTDFSDGDATPSIKTNENNRLFRTTNTSPTTITDLDDGYIHQTVNIIINDANTTVDFTGTNLTRAAGTDWSPASGDFMRCIYDGSTWYCDTW